jgi:hypothetical protein
MSENIKEMLKHFSVIEWHYYITEHGYTYHDDHPLLRKHKELLYISFIGSKLTPLCIRKFQNKLCSFFNEFFARNQRNNLNSNR